MTEASDRDITAHRQHIFCNFCGLHDGEVKRLAVGRGSAICNDCVEVAKGMFDEADAAELRLKDEARNG